MLASREERTKRRASAGAGAATFARHFSVSMLSAFMAALIHPMSFAPISESFNCDSDRSSGRVALICSRHRRSVSAVTPFLPRVGLMPSAFSFAATALLASSGERPVHSSREAAPTVMPISA